MSKLKSRMAALQAQFQGLQGVPPGQWPLAPRLLCAAGVMGLIMTLGWFVHWSSQLEEMEYGQEKESRLRTEYQDKVQQAVSLPGLRQQKVLVGQYVTTLEKQLPSKAEMDALLSDINQAGLGRGLQFELFRPGQTVIKDHYAELPISLRITGSYHDVGAFASDIANLPRIVTLSSLSLVAGKEQELTLDAVAKTFRYLDAEEIAAQHAASKKNPGAKKS